MSNITKINQAEDIQEIEFDTTAFHYGMAVEEMILVNVLKLAKYSFPINALTRIARTKYFDWNNKTTLDFLIKNNYVEMDKTGFACVTPKGEGLFYTVESIVCDERNDTNTCRTELFFTVAGLQFFANLIFNGRAYLPNNGVWIHEKSNI